VHPVQVKSHRRSRTRRQAARCLTFGRRRGFGLIEVTIATSLLGVVVAATTACLQVALAERATTELRQKAVDAATAELHRVQALRFMPSGDTTPPEAVAPGEGQGDALTDGADAGEAEARDSLVPGSAVGELFPHARPDLNTPTALCRPPAAPDQTASFVRSIRFDWGELELASSFATLTEAGWRPATVDIGEQGWAVWDDLVPPGEALIVTVQARPINGAWRHEVTGIVSEVGP
jgi:prepilin-type N-terminal cleavage/methylation domain-containing protein